MSKTFHVQIQTQANKVEYNIWKQNVMKCNIGAILQFTLAEKYWHNVYHKKNYRITNGIITYIYVDIIL